MNHRTVDSRVASRRPASAHLEKDAVIRLPHQHLGRVGLHLGVAPQTEMRIPLNQHLAVNRAVWLMASHAAILQGLMHKHEVSRLLAVALGALLVLSCQVKVTWRFENFAPVRIMAIDAVHLPFQHRMMLRQAELGVLELMAVQARLRIPSGIVDKHAIAAAGLDVFAPGAVAGFAAADTAPLARFREEARMNAAGKLADNLLVAIGA